MAASTTIGTRIDQFINQGDVIAQEIEVYKHQTKGSQAEASIDLIGWATGELTEYITEIPGIRRPVKKYSKKILRSQKKNQIRNINKIFLAKCDYWLNEISEFLKLISIKKKNLTPEGNSQQLLRKLTRVYRYVNVETRLKHGILVLREIQQLDTVYNSEIPKISNIPKRAGYLILQKLEISLRKCIQKKLSDYSTNWWKERIPRDVRANAARRKMKNEAQWPWYKKSELSLIHYVDFTDYQKIITKRDNWRAKFKTIFKDKVILTAKLRELEPIRNAIAHNRMLGEVEQSRLELHALDIITLIDHDDSNAK